MKKFVKKRSLPNPLRPLPLPDSCPLLRLLKIRVISQCFPCIDGCPKTHKRACHTTQRCTRCTRVQVHATISDFDVKGALLVTCGFQGNMYQEGQWEPDPLVKVCVQLRC